MSNPRMQHAAVGSIPLSLPRKWIGDLLHFARAIPTVPVQRIVNIAPLVAARAADCRRISWPAIFLKAYGLVCRDVPELRRCYLSRPYSRMWQYGESTASVAISRQFQDEPGVFFAKIAHPESRSLQELNDILMRYRESPVESIGSFRRLIRITRLPQFLRRILWNIGLNWNANLRRKNFGTFGMTVYSSLGADSLHPISPLTTLLNYGPISDNGSVVVRIVYDHRVVDGPVIADSLRRLEDVLLTEILDEILNRGSDVKGLAA